MKVKRFHNFIFVLILVLTGTYAIAMPYLQDDRVRRRSRIQKKTRESQKETTVSKDLDIIEQPILDQEDSIPDSLLHPRWKIQPTQPITVEDLDQNPADLRRPDNLMQKVIYNDSIDRYIIGSKMGGTWINTPIMMTTADYLKWTERKQRNDWFKKQNQTFMENKGKDKFDFTDMHFDLGPAEKIFGPGGVRIRTQGNAELKFGATTKNIDNPSIPIRNRKTTTLDFDEKINLNVNGKVGDKVNMNLNYNTDVTFDFDAQKLKLKYDGKEDEIIKLIEAGNISFPSNSSLVNGATSLFGLRTDMQFGKLKLQMVASQKKSSTKSVSSKGGTQMTPFNIDVANYEENRHFFLDPYFRNNYDRYMKTIPTVTSGITINRVEVWVTNKSGSTSNTRNIIAIPALGEVSNGNGNPNRNADGIYSQLQGVPEVRNIDQVADYLEGKGMTGGVDYEKVANARQLTPSEYTVNSSLGYISLKASLQTDQVLGIAYEYTYGGQTYKVGEFASENTDASQTLLVKSLKNTSSNPQQHNWPLMMKNVYYLGSTVEKDKFKLDVKFQSDSAGVYLNYIPNVKVKEYPLIKLLGADRLDNNNKARSNGYFDYVDGYTVSDGRVFFPAAEPFGKYLYQALVNAGLSADEARKYSYTELYDSTKIVAKQLAEKDKYELVGQFRGTTANVISLGTYNIPSGSVRVTAGGITLTEGVDYSVDYSAGEVTILNQSLIDAGTAISATCESNNDYGQTRKTMFGVNWEYDFSKNLQLSGTLQHLREQALTTKVSMGEEPLNNTLWGVNINWKKESQWLTNMLNKIPFLHVTKPSQISFTGEFAQLIAHSAHNTQDNASYIDDFENTKNVIDVSTPTSWVLSSCPSVFAESKDKSGLTSGFNRSRMSWYNIDPLFTRRSSSLTPPHIKSDLDQLSNYMVREVYMSELYPDRDRSNYMGTTSTLPILNIAYYPNERGPYNFNVQDLKTDGSLANPTRHWGGMMRKLETTDFEAANIEYIEFWMMDPFVYTNAQSDANQYGGDFYINLGEVSEDILRDGKKFYESGMPVDGSNSWTTTQWGRIPTQPAVTYAFATSSGSRALQDVGFNGLTDAQEREFYKAVYLDQIQGKVNQAVFDSIYHDPAGDDYHYFRGTDWDEHHTSILDRYKYINNPQGNSPDSENNPERYDTSYKTMPDVEDINQDYTLNEYEQYYQYHIRLTPDQMQVGKGFIVDKRETHPTLRNGQQGNVTWYQFRIPLDQYSSKEGRINDFTSIRFMRLYLTRFQKPIVLRLANLDLVRGEWRVYNQNLSNTSGGTLEASAVSIEENSDKIPVNYILPPGIRREQDPTQPQLVESNEQSLSLVAKNLSKGEAKAVYKKTNLDLRQYKRIQMFVHANALDPNITGLEDKDMSVFIRLGSDYKSNYYEYDIPLSLTAWGKYNKQSLADCKKVWPEENMLDVPLSVFTQVKKERNRLCGLGNDLRTYSTYTDDKPNNKVTIVGNPSLGDIKTMIIGVRNNSGEQKSAEVWVNELRLMEYNNDGGWAANGVLNVQLSDFGTVNVHGKYVSEGFGGLEQGVNERSQDNEGTLQFTTNLELGKFFPDKAKVTAPLYYSVTKNKVKPKYNPMDTDMKLDDALDATSNKVERDSLESIVITKHTETNFSLSGVKVGIANKHHPMPYDPANFSFTYSHDHSYTSGETTIYEKEDNWMGMIDYSWTPIYKSWEPFRNFKNKWMEIFRRFGLNWLPQNVAFNSTMTRHYYELQERDLEAIENTSLPVNFDSQFLWNREFSLRWDLTKNLHMNFQSATYAEIEEPNSPVNKVLYADQYQAWKDSVWTSIRKLGKPLNYNQNFTLSYQLPLHLIPVFDWVHADANYNATYNWVRGVEIEEGKNFGNTIVSNRSLNVNGTFNLEKLYNHIPFLKAANERFNRSKSRSQLVAQDKRRRQQKQQDHLQKILPKNQKSFEKEITLLPDTMITIQHGKHSKRLNVMGKTSDGKVIRLHYRKIDDNHIKITNRVDSALKIKIIVTPKEPLDDQRWYKTSQMVARTLMMVRNVSISYRNQYSMSLSGFEPSIGKAFGQSHRGVLSPGLDFAFGLIDDDYIKKANEQGWLLNDTMLSCPASTNLIEDLQIRATLEPVHDLKIDLMASRNITTGRSIQFMYPGMPRTQTGAFAMTTISIGSAFESIGNATEGYHSKTFDKFVSLLPSFCDRVESQYIGTRYPSSVEGYAGKPYDKKLGGVDKYSSDVMIPAFLSAYTSMPGHSLELLPAVTRLLPNWTVRYSGLSKLPWFREKFKSFNINHAYRSIYSVGTYNSYSNFMAYMNGLGYIFDSANNPVPHSMFDISQVSIQESFSPLLGVDATFNNNMTARVEYRQTRNLSLSMTSVQLNEMQSKDWVVGLGYKVNDFNLFGFLEPRRRPVKVKRNQSNQADTSSNNRSTFNNRRSGVNRDLNLRLDFSFRRQASLTRDIATITSMASSGNTAIKLSFLADYTLNRLLTMSFYYDRQTNNPLLSSSSYPTTTQDFGLSIKFSLTR